MKKQKYHIDRTVPK